MLKWCIPVYPCSKWKKKKTYPMQNRKRQNGMKNRRQTVPLFDQASNGTFSRVPIRGSSVYLLWCRESEMMMVNELVALFLTGWTSSIIVVCFVGFTIPNYSTEDTHTNHVMHWFFKYFFIQLHISPSHVTQNEQKDGISKELYLLMNQTNLLNLQ